MNIIEAENLSKRFGQLVAVVQVSLSVTEGEIFGFLGPNGAGKQLLSIYSVLCSDLQVVQH